MRIIRGKYGRRRLSVPANISARPTTDFARENIFNVLENIMDLDGITAIDLFAGTGAISLELVSRGAASVTAVEKTATQFKFIEKVRQQLNCTELQIVRGDAFKYIENVCHPVDFIFADPPYNLENFDDIVPAILNSAAFGKETIAIVEHNKERDYSSMPEFLERRVYGSVNFSIFRRQ